MESILIGPESQILIGRGLPEPLLPPNPARRRAVVITQPGASAVAGRVMERAATDGVEVSRLLMPDRDGAKTLAAVERAYHHLADFGLGRGDTVITVGGGAVSDAGGFVAGTWMRGVELVHVPTTLLAAVDAAIGGKTAVNLAGKNLVGVFWHPSRIAVDLNVIESLPLPLRSEGAAEAIKAGLLAAPEIVAAYLEDGLEADVEVVVPAAARVKAKVVTADFRETGDRALLNLGHTIGHGIEFAAGISHGRAVAIGLVAAAAVSERLCGFAETETLIGALEAAGLPTRAPALDRDEVLTLVARDKKRTAEGLRMVLLEGIGRPVLRQVTDEDLATGLTAVGL